VKKDIKTGVIFVAANPLDAEYFFRFTSQRIEVLTPSFSYLPKLELQPMGACLLPLLIDRADQSEKRGVLEVNERLENQVVSLRREYSCYSFETIAKHSAVIFFPYSAYSISLSELIQLGIPVLIPSDSWMIRNNLLVDVRLYPLYGREGVIRRGDQILATDGSLNSCSDKEFQQWLEYASWNLEENKLSIFRWENLDELESLVTNVPKVNLTDVDLRNQNTRQRFLDFIEEISSNFA
jgi:hypothetical protein